MIIVDLWESTNFGISSWKSGLDFLIATSAIYIRPRVDLEIPPISMAPEARNTENPRFFKHGCWNSPTNSTIYMDFQICSNFGISNGKLELKWGTQATYVPKSVNKARDREKPRKRINESEKIRALQDPLACIKAHRHPPIRGKLGETNRRERERETKTKRQWNEKKTTVALTSAAKSSEAGRFQLPYKMWHVH